MIEPFRFGPFEPPDLEDAITQALHIGGAGRCSCKMCEGCEYEREELRIVLKLALAKLEGRLCRVCEGWRYVHPYRPEPPLTFGNGKTPDAVACPRCQGTGVQESLDFDEHIGFETGHVESRRSRRP